MTVARRTPGPAYANLQRRKPREVWRGRASDAMGTWRLSCPSASTTFAIWHELCEWVKTPFAAPVTSKSYALQKGHIFQLVRYVPDGSLCTASVEQIFPRDGVQRNYFELTLYTTRDHDCILQSHRFGYSKLSTMQMSPRHIRCAPNAVDDRTRDHHADRSSVLGTCFWPLIVQVRRSHRSIHCWHGHAARRSALPRERFSPLATFRTWGEVWLKSVMPTKADVRRRP